MNELTKINRPDLRGKERIHSLVFGAAVIILLVVPIVWIFAVYFLGKTQQNLFVCEKTENYD